MLRPTLPAVLATAIVAACASGNESEDDAARDSSMAEASTDSVVDEPLVTADASDLDVAEVAIDASDAAEAPPALGPGSAVQVSVGYLHACARSLDGDVRCWGVDCNGELGPVAKIPAGGCQGSLEPTAPIDGIGAQVKVLAGHYMTCAVGADTKLRCWGNDREGMRGDGVLPAPNVYLEIPTIAPGDAIDVLGGGDFIVEVGVDRRVRSWGYGVDGHLAYDATGPCELTAPSPGVCSATPTDVFAQRASLTWTETHGCFIDDKGVASCWGENSYGELGDGTYVARFAPAPVVGLPPVVEVAVGSHTSVARTASGDIYRWGLTLPPSSASAVPLPVTGFASKVTRLVAGGGVGCAILDTRDAQCWGNNKTGMVGAGWTGASVPYFATPVFVSKLKNVVDLSIGALMACAVVDDGSVYCWGERLTGSGPDWTLDYEPRKMAW